MARKTDYFTAKLTGPQDHLRPRALPALQTLPKAVACVGLVGDISGTGCISFRPLTTTFPPKYLMKGISSPTSRDEANAFHRLDEGKKHMLPCLISLRPHALNQARTSNGEYSLPL